MLITQRMIDALTPILPEQATSHLIETYGDSFVNDNNGISAALRANTSFTGANYSQVRDGVGGNNLGQIKTRFDAAFPIAGTDTVLLEGGINNIANPPARTNLATMQADMSAMASTVLATSHKLIIVGLTPWKGHAEWTQPLQDQTDQYNAWLAATYPNNYVELYSKLEDPANSDQIRPEYFVDVTNLHPSLNGYRELDYQIGIKRLIYSGSPNSIDLTGNIVPDPRDTSTYVNKDSSMGGNPVVLADGNISNVNGIVTIVSSGISNNAAIPAFTGAASGQEIEASVLMREGNNVGARFDVISNSGSLTTAQINMREATLGTVTGNGSFVVEKFDRGWIKITCNISGANNVGVTANELKAWTMREGEIVNTPGDGVTPGSYVDAFTMKAV